MRDRMKGISTIKVCLVIGLSLVCCTYVAAIFLWGTDDVRRIRWGEGRVIGTKNQLDLLRLGVGEYLEQHGRPPDSMDTLRAYLKDVLGVEVTGTECVSDPNGNTQERGHLDDSGGWFYDPKTGEIKVNLTEPLERYLPGYQGRYQGQIPSSW